MKLKFRLAFNPSDDENNILGVEFNQHKDAIFLCGSLDVLGYWNLSKAVEMTPSNLSNKQSISEASHKTGLSHGSNLDIIPDSYSPYSSISSASSIDFNPDNNLYV